MPIVTELEWGLVDYEEADDNDIYIRYSYFLEELSAILNDISEEGKFFVRGSNIGWRNLHGTLECTAKNAEEFIQMVFPKTDDWSFDGKYNPKTKTLKYMLAHHDSPTGENYTVMKG